MCAGDEGRAEQVELGRVVRTGTEWAGAGKSRMGRSEQAGVGEKRRGREGCWATRRPNLGRERKKRARPDLELG